MKIESFKGNFALLDNGKAVNLENMFIYTAELREWDDGQQFTRWTAERRTTEAEELDILNQLKELRQ